MKTSLPLPVRLTTALLLLLGAERAWAFQAGGTPDPELLLDIELEPNPEVGSSAPIRHLAASGDQQLFEAALPVTGRELFLTDGTTAGTRALPQLSPLDDSTSTTQASALPNGIMVLGSERSDVGAELFRVDPQADTLELIVDLNVGEAGSEPAELTVWNGEVWFTADDGLHGRQVWRTDGTSEGTARVTGVSEPVGLGGQARIIATQGPLFLITGPGVEQLWSIASPEMAPLLLLAPPPPAFGAPLFRDAVATQDFLYFAYDDQINGREPWVSDGTPSGTQLLVDLTPGADSSFLALHANADLAFLRRLVLASPADPQMEFYVSDGTSAGTNLLLGTNLERFAFPDALATATGLFFPWYQASTGEELWFSDGTQAGTYLLGDFNPGTGSSTLTGLVEFAGSVYFATSSAGSPQTALWRSDGALAGTALVEQYSSQGPVWSVAPLGASNQSLFLQLNSFEVGGEPGVLLPSATSVMELVNLVPDPQTQGSQPDRWLEVAGRVFFEAGTKVLGRELWSTDGGQAGTGLALDLALGSLSSDPRPITALGDRLLFHASDGSSLRSLWSTDGTAEGTTQVSSLGGAIQGPEAVLGVEFEGQAYLLVQSTPFSSDAELWISDETQSGTELLPVPAQVGFVEPVVFAGKVWFVATEGAAGEELWSTDGTLQGTQLASDLIAGPSGSSPRELVVSGDLLYANTLQGTDLVRVNELGFPRTIASFFSDQIRFQQPFGERGLAFATAFGVAGDDVWVTDGTAAGVTKWSGVAAGPIVEDLQVAGDKVYYVTSTTLSEPVKLWASDGTPEGEVLVGEMDRTLSTALENDVEWMFSIGSSDRVLVFMDDLTNPDAKVVSIATPDAGALESWTSFDGGAFAGIRLVDRVLLAADNGVFGLEPFVASVTGLGGFVAEPYGQGCGAKIGSSGEARLGGTLEITLNADPLAPSWLYFSLDRVLNPLGPTCQVLIGSVIAGYPATTDVAGNALLPLEIPNVPSLVGFASYWQWASLSPGGPFSGIAVLSDGLELVIGS